MRVTRWIIWGMMIGFIGWSGSFDLVAHQTDRPQTRRSVQDIEQSGSSQSNADSSTAANNTFKKARPEIDAKRRKELLRFVRENHPELEPLVKSLRDKRPLQFEKAISAIDRSVSSLQALKDSGRESRYEEALESWKLNSRIQLLSAQLSIEDTPARRAQLTELIKKQFDERFEQLRSDRKRAKIRWERLDTLVTETKSNRAAAIARRMESIIASSQRIRKSRQSEERNPPNSADDKTKPNKE